MRADIFRPPMHKPPDPNEHSEANRNNARVIHSSRISRKRIREAIDDDGDNDVDARDRVNKESRAAHPEKARLDVLAARKEMREDGEQEGDGGEEHERADEGVECCCRAHVDRTHACRDDAACQRGVEGALPADADGADVRAEWRGVIASQSVEGAACDDVASDRGCDYGQDDDNEEAQRGCLGAGSLVIDVTQGAD